MNNAEQPIYPIDGSHQGIHPKQIIGLTKREYFAGLAMQGHLANANESTISSTYVLEALGLPKDTKYSFEEHYTKYIAQISVKYSDALLNELSKTEL
jgi:hypothetical protein